MPYDKVLEFKTRANMEGLEEEGQELEKEAYVHDKEEVLIKMLYDRVEKIVEKRPVFVFMGKDNLELCKDLENLTVEYGIPFVPIKTTKEATQARQ